MKKLLFTLIFYFIFSINVFADSINKISMDIYVDSEGDAHVTEKWDVNVTSGTEGYKPYYNIGKSIIKNFEVYNQENTKFSFTDYWNTNASFSEKAYKNGMNYIDDGLELCWGISKYGQNIYTLKYEITGFVAETTDSQMIYWTLIPHNLSFSPKEVNIAIYSEVYFSKDTPVWGYGNYGGTAYVGDGHIKMNSDGSLASYEYMTILAKFAKGTFNTKNSLSESFNHYYNMAEEGARHYSDKKLQHTISLISTIIFIILMSIAGGVFIYIFITPDLNKNFKKNISKGKFKKNLNYFRDIPCNCDIFYAYFLAESYLMTKRTTDFFGSIILFWIKKGYLEIIKDERGKTITKYGKTSLILNKDLFAKHVAVTSLESKLFYYMYEASLDGVLESSEFEKYCKINYKIIWEWFDNIQKEEKIKCVDKNLLIIKGVAGNKYFETKEIYEEASHLYGLKKFLNDFSSIEDKSAIEVHLWEYYLIYAQIFGIADKVSVEFKRLYPNQIMNFSYDDYAFISSMSSRSMSSATRAGGYTRKNNYSSGGGGHSSGGGGGGSFGGGSGGGGFR